MLFMLYFCYYVLCDNVFILMCVCRILIKGYLLTYLRSIFFSVMFYVISVLLIRRPAELLI